MVRLVRRISLWSRTRCRSRALRARPSPTPSRTRPSPLDVSSLMLYVAVADGFSEAREAFDLLMLHIVLGFAILSAFIWFMIPPRRKKQLLTPFFLWISESVGVIR